MATKCSDGRFKATWRTPEGKRESFYSYLSREDAERLKSEKIHSLTRSNVIEPRDDTLEELAMAYWWPSIQQLTPNTIRKYTDTWNHHIAPKFCDRRVATIKSSEVQRWANDLRAKLSAASTIFAATLLSGIFKEIIRNDGATFNPASGVRLPSKPERERILTIEQLRRLLRDTEGTELAAPVFLAAMLGMRRGEICGLKWEYVDLDTGRIRIVQQRKMERGSEKGKAINEGALKSKSSRRSYTLTALQKSALESRGNLDSDYVATRRNGKPWNPEHLTSEWALVRTKLGLPDWHFHDLRHGAGSVMKEAGVDLQSASKVFGHKSPDMTLLYTAMSEETATKALAMLDDALKP